MARQDSSQSLTIRVFDQADLVDVLTLSLAAWAPIYESFRHILGDQLYYLAFPDWEESQARAVRSVCLDEQADVWIGMRDGRPAGFVVGRVDLATEPLAGEIQMIAVDPRHHRSGVATELLDHAIEQLHDMGAQLITIATGGDPGHQPARELYEKAGFRALPLVRYYRRP